MDTEKRMVNLPEELVAALERDGAAAAAFGELAYSHRKEYADWVGGGKKAETRAARAQKAVERVLAGKKGR